MVVVPAGVFDMGSSSDEEGHDPTESPRHRVSIGRPFAIARYETTVREWRACFDDDGCLGVAGYPREGDDRLPIMGIAWVLIPSYLDWLNANSGHNYRLPSEAEWEYAARAGSLTRYAFGEELTTGDARVGGKDDGPVEVGSYQPNAWGLYDMHGNLAEWVQDCWHTSYAAPTDGSAWVPECIARVVRGGSWKSDAGAARSAARDYDIEATSSRRIGFRVVRSLSE
jgi:formylglycine-generating enzyme required for sulfatase activity